jgi:hypothetical protein
MADLSRSMNNQADKRMIFTGLDGRLQTGIFTTLTHDHHSHDSARSSRILGLVRGGQSWSDSRSDSRLGPLDRDTEIFNSTSTILQTFRVYVLPSSNTSVSIRN